MHTIMQTNGEPCSPTHAIAGFVKEGFRVRVPPLAHDISDLTPKNMHTNAYNSLECIRNPYKLEGETWVLLKNGIFRRTGAKTELLLVMFSVSPSSSTHFIVP